MAVCVIIDGNNLLHAMHAHAPIPAVGRETMVKIIERWAESHDGEVTLVFDGPKPRSGLLKQMASDRISVRFSEKVTADDVIVELIGCAKDPGTLRIVTSDSAIRTEAHYRRCEHLAAADFVSVLYPEERCTPAGQPGTHEKPAEVTPDEAKDWLDQFGYDPDASDDLDLLGR